MIFFECYADESLLKFLGLKNKDLAGGHSLGRSRVSAKLRANSGALGLVDEDPNAPRDEYLDSLFHTRPLYEDGNFLLVADQARQNRLLVVKPNLEEFVIRVAREKKVDLSDKKFALASDASELHDLISPKYNIKKREKFVEFLEIVADHRAVSKLKELVKM